METSSPFDRRDVSQSPDADGVVFCQNETEWMNTGEFTREIVSIDGRDIQCAYTQASGDNLAVLSGGIPRDSTRRAQLPVINKLYGFMSLGMLGQGVSSVMYNQPATGRSGGDWDKETIRSRSGALSGVSSYFSQKMDCAKMSIVGSSVAGYMAVSAAGSLMRHGKIPEKLVLISPGAYPENLEDIPYGEEFTRKIREEWDFASSPVFSRLESYVKAGGSLRIAFCEGDGNVVPLAVQEEYQKTIKNLQDAGYDAGYIYIPGVGHNFTRLDREGHGSVVDDGVIKKIGFTLMDFLHT